MSHFFNHTAEQWSGLVQHAGTQAAFVAILACLFLFVTQRFISSPLRYAILLVVLVKFATPPYLDLQTGVFTKYSELRDMRNSPDSTFSISLVADDPTLEKTVSSDASRSRVPASPASKTTAVPTPQPASPRSSVPIISKPAPESEFSWARLLLPLYLLGTAVLTALLFHRYRNVRRIVRAGRLQQDGFLFSEVTRISKLLRIKSVPALRITDETDAPFAMGAFRPTIVIPRAIADQLQHDQLTIIIAHELAHIRRRDLLIGWFETVVSIVWWFHPALWWLRISLRKTREDCCDDLLLAHQLAKPERYCETLIEAASRQSTRLTEPLVLGFVHQEHPAARRIRRLMDASLFRANRLRYPALIFTVLFALIMLPGLRPEQQPVTETTLEGWLGWKNLPFRIGPDEEAAVQECNNLAQTYNHTMSGIRKFTFPETREKLEAILTKHPKLFYAQQLLGTWHQMNGNHKEATRLLKESLANAPIVLTQTYQFGNGEPLKGVTIPGMQIECNRVEDHSLDPSLKLQFVALITDSKGQIHLPVYDTVYRTTSQSTPDGYFAEFQNRGWIRSYSRNGILPNVLVWKRWSQPRNFTRTADESQRLKNATGTDTLNLTLGTNTYRIGTVARGQADNTFIAENGKGISQPSISNEYPEFTNGAFVDHAIINLSAPDPTRYELAELDVLDSQTKIPLRSFQYGAGSTWSDQEQLQLFSLWDKLPDTVDLILKVYNFNSDQFRYQIPAKEGATLKLEDATFEIKYLRAGNYIGWSSYSGFYGEPLNTRNTSEIIFNNTGGKPLNASLWVVSKSGERQNLKNGSWVSHRYGSVPIKLMMPLSEIAYFELRPQAAIKKIYFENIQLPARRTPLDQNLPIIEFPVDGQSQKYTSDVLSPLRVHFESQRGNIYSNIRFYQTGFELQERPQDEHDPDSQLTVSWTFHASIDLKHRLEFFFEDQINAPGGGSTFASSAWGHAGYARRKTPLKSLVSAWLEILPKPE